MMMTVDQFIERADQVCSDRCGMGVQDLPDTVFVDEYFDEDTDYNPEDLAMAIEDYVDAVLEGAGYDEYAGLDW